MNHDSMPSREAQAENDEYPGAGHLLRLCVAYDLARVLFVLCCARSAGSSRCLVRTQLGPMVCLLFAEFTAQTISIWTAMSSMDRTLARHHVGALPLIHRIAQRMGLRALLDAAIPPHGNDQVPVVDTLILLIYNLTLGKDPLYELPQWVDSIDRRVIGYQALTPERFTDDRFARALDRLYQAIVNEEDARVCTDISAEACQYVPRNFFLIAICQTLSNLGDHLANPKTVLAWLLGFGSALQLVLIPWVREAAWILTSIAILLALLGWASSRYFVRFDGETLSFGFRHWSKSLKLGELQSVRPERIGLWTFGGAGWRLRPGKIAYVRWFGPAVAIRAPDREYWFSCRDPDRLKDALVHAGVPAADPNV